MPFLILGAAGNLGSQLKKKYDGKDLTAWDRSDFDFLDLELLAKRLEELKPSFIINAAAYNGVDACEKEDGEARLAWLLNRDLPAALADYCLKADIPLLHYSTDYVFGGDGRLSGPYYETDKPQPLNVYGKTKFAGEKEIARRALEGLKYYIVRTSKLFGPSANNAHSKPSFFDLIKSKAQSEPELKVIDGEMSCFTYTPDLAQASFSLINDKASFGIYHLVNQGAATWYQGAKELLEILNINTPIQAMNPDSWQRPASRPKFSVLANTRRRPLRPWQEALREYLQDKNK